MPRTPPPRLVSSTVERARTRQVREVEQPIVNITLQSEDRNVLTVAEAAYALGISRSKLYEFITAGEICAIYIGRLRRIPIGAIDDFIATRPATGPSSS